ncbi:MAG TPA: hypothetical protein VHC19_18790 [Pirellulales bacterium]|nr:hypothetical protein [Pirellulales bacterium]
MTIRTWRRAALLAAPLALGMWGCNQTPPPAQPTTAAPAPAEPAPPAEQRPPAKAAGETDAEDGEQPRDSVDVDVRPGGGVDVDVQGEPIRDRIRERRAEREAEREQDAVPADAPPVATP